MLNSDIEARPGWLACLQYASAQQEDIGIVGARLLYPDGRIQFAGTARNLGAPEWFDHRYRFKPDDWGPAGLASPVLAVTGACMYVKRAVIERVGLLDERYPMAYEDVDWCLRAWQAGFRVLYFPAASLYHHESVTRGTDVGERERASQRFFWERWGDFFDARDVRAESGGLRVIYVTEDTGVGGGHRDIFEHLNRLLERGHEVALYTLGEPPDWFPLRVPVHSFEFYDELIEQLADIDAIKVATWWNTAAPVWRASVLRGIPVYFVQDIETSYYPDDERTRHAVIDSYRPEFRYMTISSWNRERLRELGLDAALIPPGIDLDTFRPLASEQRRQGMVLALGRTNPLKNLPLTIDAWRALPGATARAVPVRDRAGARGRARHALRGGPQRRGRQRAPQPGHAVRPDLHARGLRAAAARGDGHRRGGGVHRRARQPRLLPPRRELPDAGAQPGRGDRRAAAVARRPAAARTAGTGWHRDGAGVLVGAAHRRAGGVSRGVGAPHPARTRRPLRGRAGDERVELAAHRSACSCS